MTRTTPRVLPLNRDEYTEEQAALVQGRDSLNMIRVLARYPDMYRAFIPWCEKVSLRSELPERDREMLLLRTLSLCGELYETTHHVVISGRYGWPIELFEAARAGEGLGLTDWDKVLLRAAEDLFRDKCIGDATWEALSERYSEVQKMDLVFLVGNYTTVAMLSKSFGWQVEEDYLTNWKPN